MKKLIIIPVFFLFLNCACTNCVPNKMETYKYFNSQILVKLEDELPLKNIKEIEKSDFVNAVYPNAVYAIGYSAYFVGFTFSIEDFETNLNYIKSKCKKVSPNQAITYVSPNQKKREGIILPDMSDKFNNTDNFIKNNSNFFLYKSEEGKFLNNEFSSYYEKTSTVKHGFQSGAIIDENSKKIVYWLIMW